MFVPEDCAIEDVPDGAVGALPHLLQLELLHTRLIRGDGGTLDANIVLLQGSTGHMHRNMGHIHQHLPLQLLHISHTSSSQIPTD